jgi:hypothetical protein
LADVDFGPVMLAGLDANDILDSFLTSGQTRLASGTWLPQVDLVVSTLENPRPAPPLGENVPPPILAPGLLLPGDADRDRDFDQYDVMKALSSGKYSTGVEATWGEGDWNGGPGSPDQPPLGDGVFDRFDIVAAQRAGAYRRGPYDQRQRDVRILSPIRCCGIEGDDRTSVVYNPGTGELSVDTPFGGDYLTSLNVESAAGIFTGDAIPRAINWSVFDIDDDHTIFKVTFGGSDPNIGDFPFGPLSFGNVAQPGLAMNFLLNDLSVSGSITGGGLLESVDLIILGAPLPALMPGDADQDLKFDQLDIVKVLVAAKYLTGEPATWGEGDWNAAPGGRQGQPPRGDGLFNQSDIVAALAGDTFLAGPYAALRSTGQQGDGQTSIVYNAVTGELAVDGPSDRELTSINISSAARLFTGDPAQNLGGDFDNDADDNIFKATFGSSFGSLSFGNVAQTGLSQELISNDLTVVGSLARGGDLGNVDLIYIAVPEPATILLALTAVVAIALSVPRQSLRQVRIIGGMHFSTCPRSERHCPGGIVVRSLHRLEQC